MLRLISKRSLEVLRLYEGVSNKRVFFIGKDVIPITTQVNYKNNCILKFSTLINKNENSNNEPNAADIVGDNTELQHKLKVLILEAEVWRQEGKPVPSNASLRKDHWLELLKLSSMSGRRKYLEFLFKTEKKKENRMKKKEQKRLEREQNPKPVKDDSILNYDLGANSIFLRFYDTTMNHYNNNRLIQAMLFGQKLVIDCGYYDNMTSRENSNCAKQLMLLFAENRTSNEPFDLHYCNANPDSNLMRNLHKFIATMYEPSFPLHIYEKSYLEMFPKEKLVYLTPHCREVLKEYDHDAIYIIGGIVDKVNNEPLSMAKAKKEGLRMAKLPLDHYLEWGAGSGKTLTLNQVTSILLDVKRTGDWKYALKHVPRRKLADFTRDVSLKNFNYVMDNFKSVTHSLLNSKSHKYFETSKFKGDNLKHGPDRLSTIKEIMKK